uniref:WD40 repeat domain-containing protein n=1 Tax=uncultured Mucilaginibacter sp. TaxID=797541 RepID=UPI00345BF65D
TVSNDTIRSISISPDEKNVAFGCRNNHIYLYDLSDYTVNKALLGHTMAVFAVKYFPGGRYLISGSRDAQLKIWDNRSFEMVRSIPAHLFAINAIAFHPTLPYFATASMDKSIKIWSADDFKLHKTISREKGFESHQLSINKIVWNDNQLISAGDDKKIMIWEISVD